MNDIKILKDIIDTFPNLGAGGLIEDKLMYKIDEEKKALKANLEQVITCVDWFKRNLSKIPTHTDNFGTASGIFEVFKQKYPDITKGCVMTALIYFSNIFDLLVLVEANEMGFRVKDPAEFKRE